MKKWIVATLASLFSANLALAGSPICDALKDKRVPIESRKKFAQACEKNNVFTHCQTLADDKKLLGDAKANFMQKCASIPPAKK